MKFSQSNDEAAGLYAMATARDSETRTMRKAANRIRDLEYVLRHLTASQEIACSAGMALETAKGLTDQFQWLTMETNGRKVRGGQVVSEGDES